jgi:hypothetical protein
VIPAAAKLDRDGDAARLEARADGEREGFDIVRERIFEREGYDLAQPRGARCGQRGLGGDDVGAGH